MEEVVTVGLDIAKSVFQVRGVDAAGRVVMQRKPPADGCARRRTGARERDGRERARSRTLSLVGFGGGPLRPMGGSRSCRPDGPRTPAESPGQRRRVRSGNLRPSVRDCARR